MAPLSTWWRGEWVEVKTLALGEVTRTTRGEVCTQHLSYFSRLSDAASFEQAALVETQRRGLERASEVCAVQDGAEWLQGLVDYHRADAVRILDFAHAAEYVNAIGQAVQAAGGQAARQVALWRAASAQTPGTRSVCSSIWPGWPLAIPVRSSRRNWPICRSEKHTCSIPRYQQAGWPIGSGSVESANKVVVEARLKGAGMRWERQNVNPMLVLRNAVCNRRWHETWATGVTQRQAQRTRQRQADSHQRLTQAFWTLVCCTARLARLTPPPSGATEPAAAASPPPPVRRLGAGYSWRQPFLRRPASPSAGTGVVGAKK